MNLFKILLPIILIFVCEDSQAQVASSLDCTTLLGFDVDETCTCGKLAVPENHDQPSGKQIEIAYIIIPALETNKKIDPLIYFSGGPGGAALTHSRIRNWQLNPIRKHRDVILFDQRGTGHSAPLPNMDKLLFKLMSSDLEIDEEVAEMAEIITDTRRACEMHGIGVKFYNSFQNAKDVGRLMHSLSYEKYNLYGVSYGTRLARIVQDLFPDKIHSVILNSPNPLKGDFLVDRLQSYSLALGRIFEYCQADVNCDKDFPNLQEAYLQAIKKLQKEPLQLLVDDMPFVVNAQDAIYLIRRKLYGTDSRERIPELIDVLNSQSANEMIEQIILGEYLFSPSYNSTMWLSVERSEMYDLRNTKEVIAEAYKSYPLLPASLGMFTSFYLAGKDWHDYLLTPTQKQLNRSSIPTLITVNQYDPVTPPENGKIMMQYLDKGRLYILDEGGHGGGNDACRNQVMVDFMNHPEEEPNVSCLNIYRN